MKFLIGFFFICGEHLSKKYINCLFFTKLIFLATILTAAHGYYGCHKHISCIYGPWVPVCGRAANGQLRFFKDLCEFRSIQCEDPRSGKFYSFNKFK